VAPLIHDIQRDPVGSSLEEWEALFASWGERPFRARQVFRWIHTRSVADPAGMTEGSRGYDGIMTIAAAITKAGAPDAAKIREALWGVQLTGLTGKIAFEKVGQAGKESAQSTPQVSLVRIEGGKIALVK